MMQVLGGLLLGDARSLAERVSEGRSGSLFYYSHDNRSALSEYESMFKK